MNRAVRQVAAITGVPMYENPSVPLFLFCSSQSTGRQLRTQVLVFYFAVGPPVCASASGRPWCVPFGRASTTGAAPGGGGSYSHSSSSEEWQPELWGLP
jgi:hypothetical protein